jgi:hypothetical protein
MRVKLVCLFVAIYRFMGDYEAIFISDYTMNNCIVQEAIFAQ